MLIVIAGANGGLGAYVAVNLKGKGYSVLGTYCSHYAADVPSVFIDAAHDTNVATLIDEARALSDQIVLVNMIGVGCAKLAHKMSPEEWYDVVSVNLDSAFHLARRFVPVMREAKWGRIINTVSVVSQLGTPGTSAYAAAKEGIVGLTRVVAKENAKYGITANCLSLGYFDRGMITTVPEKMLEVIKDQIPVGHFGHPDNIVAAIEFLVAADYVTGAVIPINGGLA